MGQTQCAFLALKLSVSKKRNYTFFTRGPFKCEIVNELEYFSSLSVSLPTSKICI